MRIRLPFAIAFIILLVVSSSLGLLPHSSLPSTPTNLTPYIPSQSDKILHVLDFFALTLCFYFIVDTGRKRVMHLTLVVCTLVLGVGSEIVQWLLPNGRDFDAFDVLANIIGSLAAIGLAGAYHRRSAERRRRAKYSALAGGEGIEENEDVELGGLDGTADGIVHRQENGVVSPTPVAPGRLASVEEEVDNWDEHADDDAWDEDDDDEGGALGHVRKVTPATSTADSEDVPRKIAAE